MQKSGTDKRALIITLAIAGHLLLQMFSAANWANLAPLLIATLYVASLKDLPPWRHTIELTVIILAIAGFSVSYVLSSVFSEDRNASMEVSLALLSGPLLLALLLQIETTSHRVAALRTTLTGVALAGALYLSMLMLSNLELTPGEVFEAHYSSAFVVPNDVLFLVCLAPFALNLLLHSELAAVRGLCTVTILAIGAAIMLTESRTGLLLAIATLGMFAASLSFRWVVLGSAAFISALILVDWLQGFSMLGKVISTETLGNRPILWLAGIESLREYPWLGRGPGTFEAIYYDLLSSGKIAAGTTHELRSVGWAHSLYIEALAERGIVGLATLLGLFGAAAWCGLRNIRHKQPATRGPGPELISLMTLLLAGAVELTFMRTWVVSTSFLLLGLILLQPGRHLERDGG